MTYTSYDHEEHGHYVCDGCGAPIWDGEDYTRTVHGEVGLENGHPQTHDQLFGDIYHVDCHEGGEADA